MKLQIGCGRQYLVDAINVDRFDSATADLRSDATCLPLKNQCVDEVISHHSLEHLGYGGALFALFEWHRVLSPGGRLEIETPDPDACFADFLNQSSDMERAQGLTFIFGEEKPGQSHPMLFPKKLLRQMVVQTGFKDIRFTTPKTHLNQPSIRLEANRDDDSVSCAMSMLRQAAAFETVSYATPLEVLELEQTLWEPLRSLLDGNIESVKIPKMLVRVAITAPPVAMMLEPICREWPVLMEKCGGAALVSRLGEVASRLQAANCCDLLRRAFLHLSSCLNSAADGHEFLITWAGRLIEPWLEQLPSLPHVELQQGLMMADDNVFEMDRLVAEERHPDLRRVAKWPKHHLFTRAHLVDRASWYRDVGIRCFATREFDLARSLLRLAIGGKVADFYSVWNMARLQAALEQPKMAEMFYDGVLSYPMTATLAQIVTKERQQCRTPSAAKTPVPVGAGLDRQMRDNDE